MKDISKEELEKSNAELKEKIKELTTRLVRVESRFDTFIKHGAEGILFVEFNPIPIHLPLEEKIKLYFNSAHVVVSNDVIAHLCGYNNAIELNSTKVSHFLNTANFMKYETVKKFMKSGYKIKNDVSLEQDKNKHIKYLLYEKTGVLENDHLIGVWINTHDITELKKAEDALKQNEEKYHLIAELAPQNLWSILPDGRIHFVNRSVYEYTGLEPIEYKSSHEIIKRIGHPDDVEEALEMWDHSLETGEPFQMEFRVRGKDGSYNWRLTKAVPQKDKEGNIIKWYGTGNDIHKQKVLSEKLQSKNEELVSINNNLDTFAYTASHDLKNPILNIEGLILTLKESLDEKFENDEEVSQIFHLLKKSVKTFKGTLADLSEIPKAKKNSEEEQKEIFFSEIVDEIESSVCDLIKSNHVQITHDFKECPSIFFSKSNLRSILFNLISNSIKYRSYDRIPEIKVQTKEKDRYILLSVIDNGIGISPEDQDKIFTMFERVTTQAEGTGVGLYIVKKIITDAGGTIEVESKKGVGSCFKVYLKK